MTQFKKGDRVQKVAPHNAIRDGENDSNGPDTFAREAAMGALGTVIGTAATHLYIKWDGGNTSCVPREVVAPAENHGTGDGSASDICAEPGCNCDLERRFPAPLDPKSVKPGATVTLERDGGRLPDQEVVVVTSTEQGWIILILKGAVEVRVTGPDPWLITAHTPAPEPEPEWEPGDMAAVTARGWVNAWSVRTATNDGWASHDNTDDVRRDDEVEAVRPLVVIDPAEVDVDALQAAVQEAWRTRTGDDAYEAAHAVLEHLGIEVPR